MPELANRDATERRIVAELEPIFEAEYRRALASPRSIPYEQFEADLARTMAGELADIFRQAGAVLLIGQGVVITAGAFEQAAQRWTVPFAQTLAHEVVATSREQADKAVREAGGDPQALREGLATVFMADSRLKNIAVTECTRAQSAGEHVAVLWFHQSLVPDTRPRLVRDAEGNYSHVGRYGLPVDAAGRPIDANRQYVNTEGRRLAFIWRTSRLANVCPHCRPLDGHGVIVYGRVAPGGPPLHPRCNCFLQVVEATQVGAWAA